jgi:hypothetical protein
VMLSYGTGTIGKHNFNSGVFLTFVEDFSSFQSIVLDCLQLRKIDNARRMCKELMR